MRKYIYLSLLLLCVIAVEAKVLIITSSYNRPDFIALHAKTFKAFLQDKYEYVVFNDASDVAMAKQIEDMCRSLEIRHFKVPPHTGRQDAGFRHSVAVEYALNSVGYDYPGIVVLIDSDAFLIKSFSIERFLDGYDIAGKLEQRVNDSKRVRYLSPVLVFMNMQMLPNKRQLNFYGGYVEGLACDNGAQSYYYFKNNPAVKATFFNMVRTFFIRKAMKVQDYRPCVLDSCTNMTCADCVYHLMDNGFDDNMITYSQSCPYEKYTGSEFLLNHVFFHYRCGSNWDNKSSSFLQQKQNALDVFMSNILNVVV